ncbi:MAG: hypothetical protein ACE5GV_00875 [Candidatus Scalindua sp.]
MLKLLNIKQAIAFGYICLIIAGCSYTPYRYSFSLIEPQNKTRQNDVVGQAMGFEDVDVHFKFIPSSENIRLSIKNKTDHEINLVRDKAEYIDSAGESHRIHYGQDYVQEVTDFSGDNHLYATPMKIGPGTETTGYVWINIWPDFCIGDDRHTISSYRIYNLLEPLFPRYSFEGRGEDLKGSTFNLVLPIDFGEYTRNYTFNFMINDVL